MKAAIRRLPHRSARTAVRPARGFHLFEELKEYAAREVHTLSNGNQRPTFPLVEIGENSPGRVLAERIYSTAYLWHNYGNTTIGSRSDIENLECGHIVRHSPAGPHPE